MNAIVVTKFGGPNVLEYLKVEKPVPSLQQVLIKVEATSVNFADIKARYGEYHGAGKPPFIPGLDATGVIEKVGQDVEGLKVGQRVIAFPKNGSYAQYIVADENLTFVIPSEIDFATAAACPIVSFTSYKLLKNVAQIKKGETVVIHAAAGGVGTTAIQIAKILGAASVIGIVGSESKKLVALKAGADHVISYVDGDFSKKVKELTNGVGADIILDSIAGKVTEQSLNCLAKYGRLIVFGNASGEGALVRTTDLHSSCRSVLGFSLGTTRNVRPYLLKDTAKHIFQYLLEKRLNIEIGHRFFLQEATSAHRLLEERKSTGKILLEVKS